MGAKYLVVLAVLATGFAGINAPAAQYVSRYVTLDANGELFRDAFNSAEGKVRIVAYVAPTCGGCLRGAKLLQEDVLASVRDDRIEVMVVWVQKNGARERHVDPVIKLVTDDRATHYWDKHGYVVDALDESPRCHRVPCSGSRSFSHGENHLFVRRLPSIFSRTVSGFQLVTSHPDPAHLGKTA